MLTSSNLNQKLNHHTTINLGSPSLSSSLDLTYHHTLHRNESLYTLLNLKATATQLIPVPTRQQSPRQILRFLILSLFQFQMKQMMRMNRMIQMTQMNMTQMDMNQIY